MVKKGDLKKLQSSNKTRCRIILYTSKIIYPQLPAYTYPTYALIKYIKLIKSKTNFKILNATQEYLQEIFKSTPTCDINNCILINENFHKAILNSSEYALLKFKNNQNERLVQVYPTNLEDTLIRAGDVLKFNLGEIPTCKINGVNLASIKIAKQIEIAFITQAAAVGNAATDLALKNYFKTPKLVYKNDVIEINLKQYAPDFYYTSVKLNNTGSIYFKCIKVSTEKKDDCYRGYLGMLGITAIKQGPDVQHFLPPQNEIMPVGGLEKYFHKLETAVKPFLCTKDLSIKPTFLLQGNRGRGKRHILNCLSKKYGLKLCKFSSVDITAQAYAQTETKLKNAFFKTKLCAPCILVIQDFENICRNNEGHHDSRIANSFKTELNALFESNENVIIFVAICNTKELPPELGRVFIETIIVDAPNQNERASMLEWIISRKKIQMCKNLDMAGIAGKTHGFVFEDLEALVFYAEQNFYKEGRLLVNETDFEIALDIMQSNYTDSLGAPKVPKVNWSDVGGLDDVKHEIIKTINLPLKHPELLKTGLRRSGILLFGPPGTGKTLIAKAVATECGLCFLSVKGPELLNMYVGQSEQNVREVFEKARQASPCIIFFDELDSLAPKRGVSGDSGGVMDRVVSQLLSEMDGLNQDATIFVIGATNRPDLIDSSLLRPGRFDKLLYVGACTDPISKLGVLKALTKRFKLSEKVNLEKIVKTCPENITGADFYGICSNAWMSAASKLVQKIEKGKIDPSNHDAVVVTSKDFEEAIKNAKPSVSKEDMIYFEKLRSELAFKKK